MVRITQPAWDACLQLQPALAEEGLVRDWVAAGRPLIARRPGPCDANPEAVPLGLPLPPHAGKRRLGFQVPPAAIVSVDAPPEIGAVTTCAPRHWIPTLDALHRIARRYDVSCRVFGSLAWEHLTGLEYVTASSDLDVLVALPIGEDAAATRGRCRRLLDDLARCAADAPMRIDGEVVRADGAAVQWRELHTTHADVLVKGTDRIELLAVNAFVGG